MRPNDTFNGIIASRYFGRPKNVASDPLYVDLGKSLVAGYRIPRKAFWQLPLVAARCLVFLVAIGDWAWGAIVARGTRRALFCRFSICYLFWLCAAAVVGGLRFAAGEH